MDSFFFIPRVPTYIFIYIVCIKFLLSFGHSDMYMCWILHIYVHVLVPFFLKLNVVFVIRLE